MKRITATLLCLVGVSACCVPASAAQTDRVLTAADYHGLRSAALARFGPTGFACLTDVEDRYGNVVALRLRVASHRALADAARFRRAHPAIDSVELIAQRYSVASMRHLLAAVRRTLAGVRGASVRPPEQGFGLPFRAACAPVVIAVDAMPVAVRGAEAPSPPRPGPDPLAAARRVQARFGDRVLIALLG